VATIDEGHDAEAPKDCPGWLLMDTNLDCNPTGREVGGLHENFQSIDCPARRAPICGREAHPVTCTTSRWIIPLLLMREPGGHADMDRSGVAPPAVMPSW
jgi:hypothetical protein